MKEIIEKIRQHENLGIGSCHPWDECYTDEELAELLRGKTYEEAVALGMSILGIFNDRISDAENSAF